jgi:murein peptide amidase A
VRILVVAAAALVFGHSVHGQPLRAVEVGDRSSDFRVLVIGCIHGDECSGIGVVRDLERTHPSFDLWLVRDLNPDGHAAGTRQNAHGVDLNRNFPSEWNPISRVGDAEYSGPRPFSEPETRAARALVLRLHPEVTIWFHQPQGLVRAWGPSIPAARRFARRAGMAFRALRWPRGSAANWQNHRFPDAASFVVELPRGPLSRQLRARLVAAILDSRR